MAINEIIGSGALPVDPHRKASGVADEKKAAERKDRVEVSSQARSLFEANQAKKDDEIRAQIASGFYSTPDVLEQIAAEVLKDLRSPKE